MTRALERLASELGMKLTPAVAEPEQRLMAIAKRLGSPVDGRDPGKNLTSGPLERRLRALLWKYGVPEYNDPTLNAVELVERPLALGGKTADAGSWRVIATPGHPLAAALATLTKIVPPTVVTPAR